MAKFERYMNKRKNAIPQSRVCIHTKQYHIASACVCLATKPDLDPSIAVIGSLPWQQ